uniref:hypothetical protein n=1 Tax=Amycolatopsis sp. CA-096443 TaxID=3239919 RepID=UPI003F492FCE
MQARLRELTDRGESQGWPMATRWLTIFGAHPDLAAPLLTPNRWHHTDPGK